MARKSQHSLSKMGKVGKAPFLPDLKEWIKVCKIYPYDKQIFEHFDICKETFYSFLDKQRYEKEQGRVSEYLDAYKQGRSGTREFVLSKLLKSIEKNDMPALIFGAKTYGGLLETKDIKHIELKKIEVAFKTKQFMTDLSAKFNLNYEQLEEFASKYFNDTKIEDV
jgi:hypothetical protein